MGCGVSRLDGHGMVLPAKFHSIKTFHYARPLKKELLLQDHVEDEKYSSLGKNVPNIPMAPASSPKEKMNPDEEHEEKNGKICKNDVKEKRVERVIMTNDDEAETDGGDQTDDDEDDERMIGHVDDDDEAFRGSPSFRVYFKDDGEEKHNGHENDASISSDEAKSSKECCGDKKVMKKRGRKKKSYSKNYKGVKNLLNYKSCYNTTPSSGHDHANLILTGKTNA